MTSTNARDARTDSQPMRIVLLGTHGQRNIGDELLLETFLDQLGSHHSYVVNTYDIDYTRGHFASRYNMDLIDTSGDRRALVRALHRADRLVFAGGSIIKELNQRTTGRSPYATLLMLLAIVTYARWVARIPRAMLNIGVGPIRTPSGRALARAILSQVDVVTVRDERSLDLATSIAPKARHIYPCSDAVWANDAAWFLGESTSTEPAPVPEAATPGEIIPVRVALNLNSDIADAETLQRFTANLQQAFVEVANEHPIEIHLVPMQEGFKEHDDVEILSEFAAALAGIPVVPHRPANARDVATILQNCDVLVSERFHTIVIASVLEVPSVALAYDVKVLALADQLGLESRTIDINQPFSVEQAAEVLSSTISDATSVRATVQQRASALRCQAAKGFDDARRWLDDSRYRPTVS